LDREKPVLKQLPRRKLDLRFVVKFFTPDPGMLEDEHTRYGFEHFHTVHSVRYNIIYFKL